MIIDRHISDYVVFCDDTMKNALAKMDKNQNQIIFVLDQSGIIFDKKAEELLARRVYLESNADSFLETIEAVIKDLSLESNQMLNEKGFLKDYVFEESTGEKIQNYFSQIV